MSFLPPSCTCTITRVVDGDTYCVEYERHEYIVRILGVDCFETRYGAKLRSQSLARGISLREALKKGIRAKDFAENILLGETVTIIRPDGVPDNDIYFRYLRQVFVQWGNANTNLAALLAQHGYEA
jgi:endonuclease YncB( thermonuclease family)